MAWSKSQKNWAWGTVIFGAIVGIGTYITRQYNFLYNASTKLAGATIQKLTLASVKFTAYIKLKNLGDLSVDVTEQKYDIYVGSTYVLSVTNKNKVHIKSNGSTIIPLTIEFIPKDLLVAGLQNLGSILNDTSKFVINIKGKLSFKAGILSMKDYELAMTFTLKEIIELADPSKAEPPKPVTDIKL